VISASRRVMALLLVDLSLSAELDLRRELQTLTGFSVAAYEALQQALQNSDFRWQAEQCLMMAQAINNLSGYPHGQHIWLAANYHLDAETLTALYDEFFTAYQQMIGHVAK
jgi:hypothetical protein